MTRAQNGRPPTTDLNRGLAPWAEVADHIHRAELKQARLLRSLGANVPDPDPLTPNAVRHIARKAMAKLRAALEAQGITIDHLSAYFRERDRRQQISKEAAAQALAKDTHEDPPA